MLRGLSHQAERFGGCEYGFGRVRAIIIIFLCVCVCALRRFRKSADLVAPIWSAAVVKPCGTFAFRKPSLPGIPAGSGRHTTSLVPLPPPEHQSPLGTLGRAWANRRRLLGPRRPRWEILHLLLVIAHIQPERQPSALAGFVPRSGRPELCAPRPPRVLAGDAGWGKQVKRPSV